MSEEITSLTECQKALAAVRADLESERRANAAKWRRLKKIGLAALAAIATSLGAAAKAVYTAGQKNGHDQARIEYLERELLRIRDKE